MQITVDIPDHLARQLVPEGRDAARLLLEEAVAGAYRNGRLTTEQVRLLLGLGTRMEAISFLSEHEIEIYSAKDFDEDMATMQRLFPNTVRS